MTTAKKKTKPKQAPLAGIVKKWETVLAGGALLAIALHFIFASELPLQAAIFIGGVPLLISIAAKLAKGDFGADLLAAVALVTAAFMEQYLAGTLIVLMLAGGQALESYAIRKASYVLQALASRMPSLAHRRTEKGRTEKMLEDIAVADIAVGDILEVHPHEPCPVDGTVIEGYGSMDEAYLTGEPYQISKAPGASVLSGALNGETALVIRAEKLAQDSRYARILNVMEQAEQRRPALRRMGDRIGAVFTPLALLAALVAWYATGQPVRFLAVLVVATPCPLLIAIPVTIISAISMAARRGVIIKDPVILERLPTCRTAIFDKTGTLTYGAPEMTEIVTTQSFDADKVLQLTASAELYSKHPLAGAIRKAAKEKGLELRQVETISEKPGQGLSGRIGGQDIRITHRRKLRETHAQDLEQLPEAAHGLECLVLIDGRLAAALRFHDKPRREGKSFIGHLGPVHGIQKIMLVSGDRGAEVDYLASLLGIEKTFSSQTPEQKLAIVRAETAKAPTIFMGDGINDAPALTAATVGLAFGSGSVTGEAAGAVILESSLAKVDDLLHISMLMRAIALQSALGGMLLSFIGMGFACAGYLSPVSGALLQEGIDILAILNALRLSLQRNVHSDIT
ncbi:MAG: cadmium-translocating P-type ATPase [Alphaproteobacteria bacterium]|nr:cadmium-translocating P-type ATPase [Alphaproteobacteria bacterium]